MAKETQGGAVRQAPLTAQQRAFVQGLLRGQSRRAAFRAAYDAGGMADRAVDTAARRLLRQAPVREKYEALQREAQRQADEEGEKGAVLRTVLPRQAKAALAGYKQTAGGQIEVKTHCKLRALELLGKHYDLFSGPLETAGAVQEEPFVVEIQVVE